MYAGFLSMDGVEIINNARAFAYGTRHGVSSACPPCDTLAEALGLEYTDPAADPAPWYDPALPMSKDVLGYIGQEVIGFGTATYSHDPTERVGDGATPGPGRRTHREIEWTVQILAATQCALSYAVAWLTRAVRGTSCGTAVCGGHDACVLSCCPDEDPADVIAPDGQHVPVPVGAWELRTVYDIVQIDPLEELTGEDGRREIPGTSEYSCDSGELNTRPAWRTTVTLTLGAMNPNIAWSGLDVGTEWTPLAGGSEIMFDPDEVYDKCLPVRPCTEDPTCQTPTLPPLPPRLVDPCYQDAAYKARRSALYFPAESMISMLDTVPVVKIITGVVAMERLAVRFYSDPVRRIYDGDTFDPCQACTDINIPYLPPGTEVVINGAARRAWAICNDQAYPLRITGPRGGRFDWPLFPCGGGMTVEIVNKYRATEDGQVQVGLMALSDAE